MWSEKLHERYLMINEKIKIEDNFLDLAEFNKIQELMMGPSFPWFYSDKIVSENDKNKFQFIHVFYQESAPTSERIQVLAPIINVLSITSLWRIKANLQTKTSNIVESTFHVDIGNLISKPEKLVQWTTSIFYINTNNGYTKFEDGTIVKSFANRLLTFPSNLKHCGTSCTDERTRVVINFNYFK